MKGQRLQLKASFIEKQPLELNHTFSPFLLCVGSKPKKEKKKIINFLINLDAKAVKLIP